jgi:hypothetical protein
VTTSHLSPPATEDPIRWLDERRSGFALAEKSGDGGCEWSGLRESDPCPRLGKPSEAIRTLNEFANLFNVLRANYHRHITEYLPIFTR